LNTLLKNSLTKVLICSAPDGHVRAVVLSAVANCWIIYGVQSANKPLAMKRANK
jgi:hypothetical protein